MNEAEHCEGCWAAPAGSIVCAEFSPRGCTPTAIPSDTECAECPYRMTLCDENGQSYECSTDECPEHGGPHG